MVSSIMRVGLSGARRCSGFAGALEVIKETRVAAICDPVIERCRELAGRLTHPSDIELYADYDEMIEKANLDMVVLGSPMQFHVPQAVRALNNNIHVLSEVPCAVSMEQCYELLQATLDSKAKYMMAENYCYMKPNVLVRAMVDAGVFGEVYFGEGEYIHEIRGLHHEKDGSPTWRYYWQVGRNGCTYPTHSLGPVMQWIKEPIDTVSCHGTGIWTDKEHFNDDTTLMLCKMKSGKLIKVRLDMISNRPHCATYYSLQGTKGCYEAPRGFGDKHKVWVDGIHPYCEWHDLWEFEDKYLPDIWKKPPEEAVKAGHGGGDYFVVREFIDSILTNTKPPVDIFDALDYSVPGLLSEESINRGGMPVPVPNYRDFRKLPHLPSFDVIPPPPGMG